MSNSDNTDVIEMLKELQKHTIKDMLARAKEGELSAQEWVAINNTLKQYDIGISQGNQDQLDQLREQLEKKRRRGLTPEEKTDIVVPFGKRG